MIIKNILIGDDVRHEIGNKISLMGILGSSVDIDVKRKPKDLPTGISIACIISIESIDKDNSPKEFDLPISISIGDGKIIAEMVAKITAEGTGSLFHLPVPRFQVNVTQSTRLVVHAKIKKNNKIIAENTASLDINLKE